MLFLQELIYFLEKQTKFILVGCDFIFLFF